VQPVARTANWNGAVLLLLLQPDVEGGKVAKIGSVVLILQDCFPLHNDFNLASTAGPASQPVLLF
jgi:hypothetical protein